MKKFALLSLLFLALATAFTGCKQCVASEGAIAECESSDGTWDEAECQCKF